MTTEARLHVERGGNGPRTVLLLHGMGASAEVWRGFVDLLGAEWNWVAPDLPGHGRSAPAAPYSFAGFAAAVEPLVRDARRLTVLGHSLGGAVAFALAAAEPALHLESVIGVGVKVRWSAEELAGAAAVAAKPARVFADRGEAVERALRVAGLATSSPEVAASLVAQADDGWRTAFDPAALAVGDPEMAGAVRVLHERGVPMVLAAGEADAMAPLADLAALHPSAVALPDAGHNAHVERPRAVRGLLPA